MSLVLIGIAAFLAVAALVGSVAMLLREKPASKVEDRLDMLTGSVTVHALVSVSRETDLDTTDDFGDIGGHVA